MPLTSLTRLAWCPVPHTSIPTLAVRSRPRRSHMPSATPAYRRDLRQSASVDGLLAAAVLPFAGVMRTERRTRGASALGSGLRSRAPGAACRSRRRDPSRTKGQYLLQIDGTNGNQPRVYVPLRVAALVLQELCRVARRLVGSRGSRGSPGSPGSRGSRGASGSSGAPCRHTRIPTPESAAAGASASSQLNVPAALPNAERNSCKSTRPPPPSPD
ncbi:MAG: hypothetical protein JWQ59_1683 [Cryobacterium sp.]|nr:hypothetical protein [Cryobacterium sp.]